MANNDVRKLARRAREAGAEVTPTGSGHLTVRYRGRFVLSLSSTPSDGRWLKNARAAMRRAGLEV